MMQYSLWHSFRQAMHLGIARVVLRAACAPRTGSCSARPGSPTGLFTSTTSSGVASTYICLNASGAEDSTVAAKRVPIWTPAAPSVEHLA